MLKMEDIAGENPVILVSCSSERRFQDFESREKRRMIALIGSEGKK
jgi:hypothetical protein